MFKHNLLISFRSFLRYKSAFLINLIGLSTGLASTLLIYFWINDELQVDKFHEFDKQLYQVMLHHEEGGRLNTRELTQGILAPALEEEVPEIEIAVRSSLGSSKMALTVGNKSIKADGKFVDKEYLKIFSFPIIKGNSDSHLEAKESIAISKSLALSLFNTTEGVIGKMLNWQVEGLNKDAKVTAIFEDVPSNSTENFDFILSYTILDEIIGKRFQWNSYNMLTYALVVPGTDIELLNGKIADFLKGKFKNSNVSPLLRPYSDKYLYGSYENGVQSGGRIEYVKLFGIISIFILLIACINFMNLSTAKASRKTKEVGVKKAIGASRKALTFQYLEESFLMTFISIVIALGIVALFLPQFNIITGKELVLQFDQTLLLSLLVIFLITGLVAGSYPALYLSGFKPAIILKGKMKNSIGELLARKGLVIFQFSLSVILIVSVLVIYNQIDFVQNKNLGYEKENLVLFTSEGEVNKNKDAFLNQLSNTPGILNASSSSIRIIGGGNYTTSITWNGKDPDVKIRFADMGVDYNFIETLGFEILEGRSFSKEFTTDKYKLVFNEKAIETMGLTDPIGKTVNLWGKNWEIIGVIKDFHVQSLHEEVTPLFFRIQSDFSTKLIVRIEAGQERNAIERIEALHKQYNPNSELSFTFLDQDYAQQYVAEERVSTLSRYFGGIAILISCLGLLGLTAFTAERRLKEIGVRKALGATNTHIIQLLSSDINRMIGVSILIALPLSYYLISQWLNGFAYHIDLKIRYFLGAGVSALLIAWCTVALQTVKAARVNPCRSLRSE